MEILRFRQVFRINVVLLVAALASACSLAPPKFEKPQVANGSIVIGYIDMEDAPSWYQWIEMNNEQSPKVDPYLFWVRDGMFFRVDVPPGNYRFSEFGGNNPYTNTQFRFTLKEQPEFARKVSKPGVYYIGSFKYKTNRPLIGRMTFELVPSKTPSERELLEKILPYAEHEYWKKMIVRRIGQLKK